MHKYFIYKSAAKVLNSGFNSFFQKTRKLVNFETTELSLAYIYHINSSI